MRPKVVIFTLVAAFAALGIIAVLKGVAKHGADSSGPVAGSTADTGSQANVSTNPPVRVSVNSTNPQVSEALRAALIRKDEDAIWELQSEVDGTNNAVILAALIDKVKSPEAEVRKTALDAIKQINDTNAVPLLEDAEKQITDPRGKVAVLDTIDYLKLPDIMPNTPVDTNTVDDQINPNWSTNRTTVTPLLKMNPKFLHRARNNGAPGNSAGPAPAPDSPATPPQ